MNGLEKIRSLIQEAEGLELKVYRCPAGKLTIGYGRNLEDNGISQEEAETLLRNDIARISDYLTDFRPGFTALDPVRQAVLIEMAFNMGLARLSTFRHMLTALTERDYARASAEMLDSLWASQVGRRANRLATMMATGTWPDEG